MYVIGVHSTTTLYKLDVTAESGILIGFSEGDMSYKVNCMATKSVVYARDPTFIEGNDEQLFIDEYIIEMEEKSIYLKTKHRTTINTKVIKKSNLFFKTITKGNYNT